MQRGGAMMSRMGLGLGISRFRALPKMVQADYYVDATNGSDSNDGTTPDTAWKTINKVNTSTFSPGEHIVFKAGETWREALSVPSSGESGNPITFGAYGSGNKPVISGADVVTGWTETATDVYSASVTVEPNQVFMDGERLTKGADENSLADHEWFWTTDTLYVKDASGDPDTSGVTIEASSTSDIMDINGNDYLIFDGLKVMYSNGRSFDCRFGGNITIQNCTIQDSYDRAAIIGNGGTDYTFNNCTISGTLTSDSIYGWEPDNVTIKNCAFTDVSGANSDHVQLYNGNNATIQNNSFSMEGTDSGKGNVILISWTTALIEYNETSHGNYGFDVNGSGITVQYNHCHDHTGESWSSGVYSGQDVDIHSGLTVRYNIIHDCTMGMYFWNTSNHARTNHNFYNNTIYNCTSRGFQSGSNSISGAFKNNIIWCPTATHAVRVNNPGTWDSDYNNLGPEGTDFIHWDDVTGYDTLSSFQSGESQDANSISNDPSFTDEANDDFTLQEGSPCINAGVDVGLTEDYAGNPIVGTPDIGAYEKQ
jgi:hypothetical protein